MKKITGILLFVCLFSACKKQQEQNYVKGELIVGINSFTPAQQVFDQMNVFNLYIEELYGYNYTKVVPADSLNYLIAYLNTKPYVHAPWNASYLPDSVLSILAFTPMVYEMSPANQQDFLQTMQTLGLQDDKTYGKSMLIKVPVGTELFWRDRLKTQPWVIWCDLNTYGGLRPFVE